MSKIPANYLEKVYAGWLGKVIGVRYGAQIEGWTYEKIRDVYGELTGYPVDYRDFAADDDTNVPLFFLRALEDCKDPRNLRPQEVAQALLNYAPYEHGFFWWGGYGVSTEHTAYLNLRHGMEAPRSGSAEQNGLTVAEQIGGQIFIDTWGLAAPGNPSLAAKYATAAASVTHDKNGIYGGVFIAVCISLAFVKNDVEAILNGALEHIPEDCEYARVVRSVMRFYRGCPGDWRACFAFVKEQYGYDRYAGSCHIIPNAAVIALSLLYGRDGFSDTISICNMCGWDTDCNVANAAVITGVRLGLSAIDFDRWRKPINDLLICSSVVGSLNIMDIPYGASYIAGLAYRTAGEEPPPLWRSLLGDRLHSCHFEYPGSTHALRVRGVTESKLEYTISNSTETARTGERSLKLFARRIGAGERVCLYQKTHYQPKDLHDSRYDPCFSPLLYPGQTVTGSVCLPDYGEDAEVQLYVYDANQDRLCTGERQHCLRGQWYDLELSIPPMAGACLEEVGFLFTRSGDRQEKADFTAFVDDLNYGGTPDYSVDFSRERLEPWPCPHRELSQFTTLKGVFYLESQWLHLSCSDYAEMYTGRYDWTDYRAQVTLCPVTGQRHLFNFRVQGAIRSYALGFDGQGRLALLKNNNGYRLLQQVDFAWQTGNEYRLEVRAAGGLLVALCQGVELLRYRDDSPYLRGGVGFSVREGSHCRYRDLAVGPIPSN